MQRVLVTGASGFLGYKWCQLIKNKFRVFGIYNKSNINIKNVNLIKCNLNNKNHTKKILNLINPDIVIHCAANSIIEDCEKEKEKTYQINVKTPLFLSKFCKKKKIKFIFISTDHLFSGKNLFYTERSKPSPQNFYAKSKAMAEKSILNINRNSIIIRTNFYGQSAVKKKSFSDFIINNLKKNKKITLFYDVFFTPIYINTLITATHKLIDLKKKGIFNISSNQRVSKLEFGLLVAKKFKLNSKLILRSSILSNKLLIKRPLDMSLNNNKVKKSFPKHFFCLKSNIKKLYRDYNV